MVIASSKTALARLTVFSLVLAITAFAVISFQNFSGESAAPTELSSAESAELIKVLTGLSKRLNAAATHQAKLARTLRSVKISGRRRRSARRSGRRSSRRSGRRARIPTRRGRRRARRRRRRRRRRARRRKKRVIRRMLKREHQKLVRRIQAALRRRSAHPAFRNSGFSAVVNSLGAVASRLEKANADHARALSQHSRGPRGPRGSRGASGSYPVNHQQEAAALKITKNSLNKAVYRFEQSLARGRNYNKELHRLHVRSRNALRRMGNMDVDPKPGYILRRAATQRRKWPSFNPSLVKKLDASAKEFQNAITSELPKDGPEKAATAVEAASLLRRAEGTMNTAGGQTLMNVHTTKLPLKRTKSLPSVGSPKQPALKRKASWTSQGRTGVKPLSSASRTGTSAKGKAKALAAAAAVKKGDWAMVRLDANFDSVLPGSGFNCQTNPKSQVDSSAWKDANPKKNLKGNMQNSHDVTKDNALMKNPTSLNKLLPKNKIKPLDKASRAKIVAEFKKLATKWSGAALPGKKLHDIDWKTIKSAPEISQFYFWWFRRHFINDLVRACARLEGVENSVIMYNSGGSETLTSDVDMSLKGPGMTRVAETYADLFYEIWGVTSDLLWDNNLYAANFYDPLPPSWYTHVSGKGETVEASEETRKRTLQLLSQENGCAVLKVDETGLKNTGAGCIKYLPEDTNQVMWAFVAVLEGVADTKHLGIQATDFTADQSTAAQTMISNGQSLISDRNNWDGSIRSAAKSKFAKAGKQQESYNSKLLLDRYSWFTVNLQENVKRFQTARAHEIADFRLALINAISEGSFYGVEAMYTHGGMMYTVMHPQYTKVEMTTGWVVEAMTENGGNAIHDIGRKSHKCHVAITKSKDTKQNKQNKLAACHIDGVIKASKYLKRFALACETLAKASGKPTQAWKKLSDKGEDVQKRLRVNIEGSAAPDKKKAMEDLHKLLKDAAVVKLNTANKVQDIIKMILGELKTNKAGSSMNIATTTLKLAFSSTPLKPVRLKEPRGTWEWRRNAEISQAVKNAAARYKLEFGSKKLPASKKKLTKARVVGGVRRSNPKKKKIGKGKGKKAWKFAPDSGVMLTSAHPAHDLMISTAQLPDDRIPHAILGEVAQLRATTDDEIQDTARRALSSSRRLRRHGLPEASSFVLRAALSDMKRSAADYEHNLYALALKTRQSDDPSETVSAAPNYEDLNPGDYRHHSDTDSYESAPTSLASARLRRRRLAYHRMRRYGRRRGPRRHSWSDESIIRQIDRDLDV